MATTGFWPIKGSLKAAIDYADNPDKTTAQEFVDSDLFTALRYAGNDSKTDRKMYVTGVNCGKFTAYEEMIAVKRMPCKCRFHGIRGGFPLLLLRGRSVRAEIHRRLVGHGNLDLVSIFRKDRQLAGEVFVKDSFTDLAVGEVLVGSVRLADRFQKEPAPYEPLIVRVHHFRR